MVAGIALLPDGLDGRWAGMLKVLRGNIVLKGLVVRDVVLLIGSGDSGRVAPIAARRTIRIGDGEIEAALEEAPAQAGSVKQITDILSAHLQHFAGRRRAEVPIGSASLMSV